MGEGKGKEWVCVCVAPGEAEGRGREGRGREEKKKDEALLVPLALCCSLERLSDWMDLGRPGEGVGTPTEPRWGKTRCNQIIEHRRQVKNNPVLSPPTECLLKIRHPHTRKKKRKEKKKEKKEKKEPWRRGTEIQQRGCVGNAGVSER